MGACQFTLFFFFYLRFLPGMCDYCTCFWCYMRPGGRYASFLVRLVSHVSSSHGINIFIHHLGQTFRDRVFFQEISWKHSAAWHLCYGVPTELVLFRVDLMSWRDGCNSLDSRWTKYVVHWKLWWVGKLKFTVCKQLVWLSTFPNSEVLMRCLSFSRCGWVKMRTIVMDNLGSIVVSGEWIGWKLKMWDVMWRNH